MNLLENPDQELEMPIFSEIDRLQKSSYNLKKPISMKKKQG